MGGRGLLGVPDQRRVSRYRRQRWLAKKSRGVHKRVSRPHRRGDFPPVPVRRNLGGRQGVFVPLRRRRAHGPVLPVPEGHDVPVPRRRRRVEPRRRKRHVRRFAGEDARQGIRGHSQPRRGRSALELRVRVRAGVGRQLHAVRVARLVVPRTVARHGGLRHLRVRGGKSAVPAGGPAAVPGTRRARVRPRPQHDQEVLAAPVQPACYAARPGHDVLVLAEPHLNGRVRRRRRAPVLLEPAGGHSVVRGDVRRRELRVRRREQWGGVGKKRVSRGVHPSRVLDRGSHHQSGHGVRRRRARLRGGVVRQARERVAVLGPGGGGVRARRRDARRRAARAEQARQDAQRGARGAARAASLSGEAPGPARGGAVPERRTRSFV
mmetsp:Transcript_6548/g.26573  ORF Transcript_6548/g.26573 Transcript_6548/m.26573 type:complete len:378 (+) Transcript_6548:357-1490(+)